MLNPSRAESQRLPGQPSRVVLASLLTFIGCVAFAFVARALNADIGYANGLGCDAWYFFGIQHNFHEIYNLEMFYQPFRFPALMPWIFLGNRIPYEALNALKFFAYFAITCAGILWFSVRLFGPKVAALITVLFCCSTGFLGVLSTDFVTAAGVAWASLLVGATVEAGHSRRPLRWGIVAGLLFGMCVYTHIPIAFFVFAIPLLYFSAPAQNVQINRFALYLAGCAVGFCIVSAMCGLYNVSLGGSWFFLGAEIRYALLLARDTSHSAAYRGVGVEWMWKEATVVSMELGVIASVAVLLVNTRTSNARASNVVASVYLLTAAVALGWQLSGRTLLNTNVFSPWIYPTLVAALGAALSRLKAVDETSWPVLTGLLGLAAGALLVAASTNVSTVPVDRLLALKIEFGLAFVIALVVLHRSWAGLIAVLALVAFTAVNYPTEYGSVPWVSPDARGRDMAAQAAQALWKLDELHVTERPAFWVDASRPETVAVPRSFLYCADFGGSFPSLAPLPGGWFESYFAPMTRETIGAARHLVVIAPGTNLAALAAPRLRRIGFESTSLGEWPIGSGALRNTMAVLRLAPATAVPSSIAATAAFVGSDTTTKGSWVGRYGHDGYAIASDALSSPGYAQITVGTAVPAYTWQVATSDSRALQRATGAGRLAAGWYAFDRLTIDVNLTDGALHQVALYGVDWDGMARDQRVDVFDGVTGTKLDTRRLDSFNGGQYLVWTVRGDIKFVVTPVAAANAVVSGVFLDPAVPARSELSAK